MLTHAGGQVVGNGTYWDIMTGLRVDIEREGTLPGGNRTKYLKASSSAVLLSGPILGLAYVIFLPIVGIVTALSLLVRKVLGGVFSLGRNIISFGWRPTEAYLGGKNRRKGDGDKPGRSPNKK